MEKEVPDNDHFKDLYRQAKRSYATMTPQQKQDVHSMLARTWKVSYYQPRLLHRGFHARSKESVDVRMALELWAAAMTEVEKHGPGNVQVPKKGAKEKENELEVDTFVDIALPGVADAAFIFGATTNTRKPLTERQRRKIEFVHRMEEWRREWVKIKNKNSPDWGLLASLDAAVRICTDFSLTEHLVVLNDAINTGERIRHMQSSQTAHSEYE